MAELPRLCLLIFGFTSLTTSSEITVLYNVTFYQSQPCRHLEQESVNLICEVTGGYIQANVTIHDGQGSDLSVSAMINEHRAQDGLYDISAAAMVGCSVNKTYICSVNSSLKHTATSLRLTFTDIPEFSSSEMTPISPIIAGTGIVLLTLTAAVAAVVEVKKQKLKSLAEQNGREQRPPQQEEETGMLLPDLIPHIETGRARQMPV